VSTQAIRSPSRALVSPPAPLRAVRHIVEPLVISGPRITRMMRQRTFFGYQPPQQHAHPWSGQRVPDAAIGNTRLFEAMRSGRFLLLDRTAGGHATRTAAADWQQRITPPARRRRTNARLAGRPAGPPGWVRRLGDRRRGRTTRGAKHTPDLVRYTTSRLASGAHVPGGRAFAHRR
jgi:hypothetical protein